jgi:uncharacterized protein involved in exopolysaccharide biosynthesis
MKTALEQETSSMFLHLFAHRKVILWITGCALLTGVVAGLCRRPEYTAETTFILKNHLFADRSYLYSKDMRYINYYAPEDDIERLVALSDADRVLDDLIRQQHLDVYYKANAQKDTAYRRLKKKIMRRVKIHRTPEKHAVLAYTDKSPVKAAQIANKYLGLIEQNLRSNYNSVRSDVYRSLREKITEEEAALEKLTDSLAKMRDYYGIYDILNPTRANMMVDAHIKHNGHPEFAKGMELIQNLESVKDRAVADLSDHISLANQYAGSNKINDLSLIQIVKTAQPPLKPSSTGVLLTALLSLLAGFCFSILYVLIRYRL